jgi:hypothetical protein
MQATKAVKFKARANMAGEIRLSAELSMWKLLLGLRLSLPGCDGWLERRRLDNVSRGRREDARTGKSCQVKPHPSVGPKIITEEAFRLSVHIHVHIQVHVQLPYPMGFKAAFLSYSTADALCTRESKKLPAQCT